MKKYNYIRRIVGKAINLPTNNDQFTLYNHFVEIQSGMRDFLPQPYMPVLTGIRARWQLSVLTTGERTFMWRAQKMQRCPRPLSMLSDFIIPAPSLSAMTRSVKTRNRQQL